MRRDVPRVANWKFYWLSSPTRPSLFDSLVFDLKPDHPKSQEVDLLAMRVVETIRRLNSEQYPRRIDLRPLSRGGSINLHEIRWQHQLGRQQLLLRLLLVQNDENRTRVGVRFFNKRLLPELAGTNQLQDLAIDDAVQIFQNHPRADWLEIL